MWGWAADGKNKLITETSPKEGTNFKLFKLENFELPF